MTPLLGLCLLATAVLVAAEWARHDPTRFVSKPLASVCFVAAAIVGGALTTSAGQAVVVALILSAAGDVFLLSHQKRWFVAGLGAFLLAHVGYVVAFVLLGLAPLGLLSAVPVALIAWAVWRWLAPKVGSLRKPVLAYIVVISTMVVCAIAAALADPSPARVGLLVAAQLFYLSDLCVARDRFIAPGPLNKTVGLPLYYGAQVLFVWFIVQI